MGWFSWVNPINHIKKVGQVARKATSIATTPMRFAAGLAGRVAPGPLKKYASLAANPTALVPQGVPKAISGTVGRFLPSAMRSPVPTFGLAQRIGLAKGSSKLAGMAELASGEKVALSPSFRFSRARKFW